MSLQNLLRKRPSFKGSQRPKPSEQGGGCLLNFSPADFHELNAACNGDRSEVARRLVDQIRKDKESQVVNDVEVGIALKRAIHSFSNDRKLAVELTGRFIHFDDHTKSAIQQADLQRDKRRWADAEFSYYKILKEYPLLAGYFVQYGHCLKEQEKYSDAGVAYRNAYALGEVEGDLIEHVSFCAARSGISIDMGVLERVKHFWTGSAGTKLLDAPPTRTDIEMLYRTLLGVNPNSIDQILEIMTACDKNRNVVQRLMRKPEFVHSNRNLLRVAFERSQGL